MGKEYIFGLFVGVIMTTMVNACSQTVITSDKRIEPKKELVIKDNKVDTLFIYKQ